jgi:hypothetical protein
MKPWFGALSLLIVVAASGFAAQQNVSINAERTTLSRLLGLFDRATGLRSTVPPELANRIVSVRFSELRVEDAVRKMFENLPLDYVFIKGQGITVTEAPKANVSSEEPAPIYEEAPEEAVMLPAQPGQVLSRESLQQPAVIPTPFGPILKSSAQNPVVQLPPVAGEAPAPPFFAPQHLPTPPAGAAYGPAQNELFRPISIHQNPVPLR